MASRTPSEGNSLLSNFDLSQIFIGREQQLDQFRFYLERWKRLALTPVNTQLTTAPSPNDKIQGLVVLLHGRGGFGKSTLLRCYREMALEYGQELTVGKIVDWEFAAQEKKALFNPAPGEEVDALSYFNLLHNQLAIALGKYLDDFKEYQSAVKAVDDARKQANSVLDGLNQDERFSGLRVLGSEGLLALLRLIPRSSVVLSNEKVADAVRQFGAEGVKIGVEQVLQIKAKLHDKLGVKLGDYLEPALRLGQGLGRDLALFAKRHSVLILFDTYEVVDEADALLRIVMGAAGVGVGWVLSGRDNLWAGLGHRLRSVETEYGYKDIVPPDRRMAVDFSADGVGDFTLSDIEEYFSQLCALPHQPPLPVISEKDAAHIRDVTQGVPLAVKIAASLYLEQPDLKLITEGGDSKREIVDQMVRRYLLHTRTQVDDRTKLYGLALLRRAEDPVAITAALNLPATSSYGTELSQLHRRYGFVFTKQEQPSLHQEVRHFLRLWLLEHRTEPEIIAINERLKQAHLTALKELEARRQYVTVRERLEDEQWVGRYLDLAEQHFWLDTATGIGYLLPFMLAASIYRRDINREAKKLGEFFETVMTLPYRKHWEWAAQSLIYSTSRNPLSEELSGLEALVKLASQTSIAFSPPLPDAREELVAALWWRLGEAYRGRNEYKALEWYEKAFTKLPLEAELREVTAETAWDIAYTLDEGEHPDERLSLLNKARELHPESKNGTQGDIDAKPSEHQQAIADLDHEIELDPKSAWAYVNRGRAYINLQEYQHALADFNDAIELNPQHILAYANRGRVYIELKEYRRAIADFDRMLELNPGYAWAYAKRGEAYQIINEYRRSVSDFDRALELEPRLTWIHSKRGEAYHLLNEHQQAIADFDRVLELNPGNASMYAKRGEAHRLLQEYQQAIADFDQALKLDPKLTWVYAKLGEVYRLLNEDQRIIVDAEQTRQRRRLSRRTVVLGAVGVGLAVAAGGGLYLTWLKSIHEPVVEPKPPGTMLYTFHDHKYVKAVAWSPDSKRIASASDDGTVKVWDAFTGSIILTYKYYPGFGSSAYTMAWSPDGKHIASADIDYNSPSNFGGIVHVWDAATAKDLYTYRAPSDEVTAVAWSPDSQRIASASRDGTVQVWNVFTGNIILTYRGHIDKSSSYNIITAVAWSSDGGYIASAGEASSGATLQVWNSSTGKRFAINNDRFDALAWSTIGKSLAAAHFTSDGSLPISSILVWDSSVSMSSPHFIYDGHSDVVNAIAWSPNSKHIASGGGSSSRPSTNSDYSVQVWAVATRKLSFVFRGHHSSVNAIAWSPDGKSIATGSDDTTVQVWKAT